jgi:hypothetical protein
MNYTRNVNGYSITYNKRCKHSNLQAYHPNHVLYTCRSCEAKCAFCLECNIVYTLNTLKKNNGICGSCNNKQKKNRRNIILQQVQPLHFILPGALQQVEQKVEQKVEQNVVDYPVSELRVEDIGDEDVNMDEDEDKDYILKNILAEDNKKKLWLVEWVGEEYATWESYETIRDTKGFQEYIEKRMSVKT